MRRTRILPTSDIEVVDGVPTLTIPRLPVELCGEIATKSTAATTARIVGW